ncbi:hypothetical protein PJL18_03816 [Paenarthrobacter nicotinovorans]|nr:hypothetical protein [Paenarthrobacter nicotinovorans]
MLRTLSSTGNGTQERVSTEFGGFNSHTKSLGRGFQLVLADGVTGVDEGSVAGVGKRIPQGN